MLTALRFIAVSVIAGAVSLAGAAAPSAAGNPHRGEPSKLLGDSRVESSAVRTAPGRAQAFSVRARASGTSTQLVVYVGRHSRATELLAALFSDHRGRPGRRLEIGRLASPRAGAWNRVGPVVAPVYAGRRYWLAVAGAGGPLVVRVGRRSCPAVVSTGRHGLSSPWTRWRRVRRLRRCPVSAYATGVRRTTGGSPGGSPPLPGPPPPAAPVPSTPSAKLPSPGAPALRPCTTTVASMRALAGAVSSAAGGAVICVAPGSYTGMQLSGGHSSDVTVAPEPALDPNGAGKVTIGLSASVTDGFGNLVAADVAPNSSHIVIRDVYLANELSIGYGSSGITVEHDDFRQVGNGGGEMINFASSNCRAPNAPSWRNCLPRAPVSNVTISGNDFHAVNRQGDDVLHTNNFRNLLVTGNEFSAAVENNARGHVDCLQNVFGGSGLTFSYNYEHDNECQGFFVKDGDITNVTFVENLFVRDNVPATNGGSSYSSSQVWNTSGLVVENNTIWDSKGLTLRCIGSSVACTARIDHNLMSSLNNGNRGDATVFTMNEGHNIVNGGAVFSPTDRMIAHPAFVCGSHCGDRSISGDDYRLAPNRGGIGIDWAPSQFIYGPAR